MSGQVFWIRKFTRGLMAAVFAFGSLTPAYAQAISSGCGSLSSVPFHVAPGMRGMTVDPADPFALTFLMEPGDASLAQADRSRTYERLIRYFLVSLTVPEDDLWVNLSPYEDGRIIADNFGMTVMGRDLLEQDHVLKQATASLFNPDKEPGKSFWKKVYQEAFERYGTTDVPIDTFNKVWVVPDEARIYEEGDSVILVQSHLKVMLEQDYLARERAGRNMEERQDQGHGEVSGRLSREAVRAWILPVLEKEVNEGEAFAVLRQATAALILATWYKKVWKGRLLNQMYSDRSRVKGVDQDPANNLKVFQAYVTE